jgi:hypothetical protein
MLCCWIVVLVGLLTANAFVVHPKVLALASTTMTAAARNPPFPGSHGIAKSCATIVLAGLMCLGIASGVPIIQPVSAAAEVTQLEAPRRKRSLKSSNRLRRWKRRLTS